MERYSGREGREGGRRGSQQRRKRELLVFYEQGRRLKKVVVKGEFDSYGGSQPASQPEEN